MDFKVKLDIGVFLCIFNLFLIMKWLWGYLGYFDWLLGREFWFEYVCC